MNVDQSNLLVLVTRSTFYTLYPPAPVLQAIPVAFTMTIFNHPHTHPYVHPFAFLIVAIHHLLSSLTTSFPLSLTQYSTPIIAFPPSFALNTLIPTLHFPVPL